MIYPSPTRVITLLKLTVLLLLMKSAQVNLQSHLDHTITRFIQVKVVFKVEKDLRV